MADVVPEPGDSPSVETAVGDLLSSALAAHERADSLARTGRWRQATAAVAARAGMDRATRRRLAMIVLEFGGRIRDTADPLFLAEVTGEAARLAQGPRPDGLYAHAASSHAGALTVVGDRASLYWFQESLDTYRTLAAEDERYTGELNQVLINLGVHREATGQWSEAVRCIDEAVARYPLLEDAADSIGFDRLAVALSCAIRCARRTGDGDGTDRLAGTLRDVLWMDRSSPARTMRPAVRTSVERLLLSVTRPES